MLPSMLRRVLGWSAYPLVTGGCVAFAAWALGRGWPIWAIGAATVALSGLACVLLERAIPYSKAWTRPRGDRLTDWLHFSVSNRAFDVGAISAVAVAAPIGVWLSTRFGAKLWPHHLPLGVQALLALALYELPWYWVHRLEHVWRPLWRIHSVHHSAERIYWLNVNRNHPIDNVLSAVTSMVPIALLGVGEAPLALAAAFSGANAMLQHSNVDMRTGVLDWLFTTAPVHRWHHSQKIAESNWNYGPTLTLWDWVFGTRSYDPRAVPPEDVGPGAELAAYPPGFLAQMRAPFDRKLWR
jgi:sterol desaturase/sphingolipid hydroxylase (fatty acid hydroxylase superfamily)